MNLAVTQVKRGDQYPYIPQKYGVYVKKLRCLNIKKNETKQNNVWNAFGVVLTMEAQKKINLWCVGSVGLEFLTVTQEITGSSPVHTAKNGLVALVGRKVQTVNLVNKSSTVGSNPTLPSNSAIVQLVRIMRCQRKGRGFESHQHCQNGVLVQLVRIIGSNPIYTAKMGKYANWLKQAVCKTVT